ncbi:MAG: acyltransferase family protein [Pseudomonadota bacterium]
MQYRREIDGLRAVAVLPVILFHAGLTFWSGGFVGVDVFFVISGYLITTILIAEREAGTYTLLGFYERRARRILPALFVVLLATIPFAWAWIPPYPFEDYARSMAFAVLFISNVHFLEHGGYFDLSADMRPLLHTWSLAVEEQYYLIFPLVLALLGAFGRGKYLAVLGLLAALSLGVAEWGWRTYPQQNFYFTPSRFWELLAGSICAVTVLKRGPYNSDLLAGLGLAMILYAAVFFDSTIPFPSVYTLVPVVGTCLIILFCKTGGYTAKLLSLGPLVWVGLISYSAYLWHQPLFAFARIKSLHEPDLALMMGLAVASLVLAYLTWAFVEQPFRGKAPRMLPARKPLLGASLLGIAAFATFGFWGKFSDGFESRLNLGKSAFLDQLYAQTIQFPKPKACPSSTGNQILPLCLYFDLEGAERSIAIAGDSHANVLLAGFELFYEELNAQIYLAQRNACPPLIGVWLARQDGDSQHCHAAATALARDIVASDVDTVLLAGRWTSYVTGDYDGPLEQAFLRDTADGGAVDMATSRINFEAGLRETVAFYRGNDIEVILLNQVPQQRLIPGVLVQDAMMLGLSDAEARTLFENNFVTVEESDALQKASRQIVSRVADDLGIQVITLDHLFLDGDRFSWLKGGNSLYTDDDHVSFFGARMLAPAFREALTRPAE